MRILMTTAHSRLLDGVNRHIMVLAPAIARCADMELMVATCLARGELNDELDRSGVNNCALWMRSIRSFFGLLRYLRLLLHFRPDVVHVEMPILMVNLSVILARLLGRRIKLVETIHGVGDLRESTSVSRTHSSRPLRERLHEYFKGLLDGVIYISHGAYEALPRRKGLEAVITNPMAFKVAETDRAKCQSLLGVTLTTPIVGTACRVAAVKRPECFAKVMIRVLERLPEVHAVVLGDGEVAQMNLLRHIVSESAVAERLHLLGYRADAKQLMASLSCFLMTSQREGMPTALLEAMSQKVPVAFWKGEGGLRDLAEMQEKEGPLAIVREQDDVEGLAQGIAEVLNDPARAKAMAERAFEVGKKVFDVDSIACQTVEFYRKVCGGL